MFPICYHPMYCILAFSTTRSYLPRWTQRLLLRYALSADLQSSDRPRGSIPGSVSAAFATKSGVTWESHVFQVRSSPVATKCCARVYVIASITPFLFMEHTC